MPSRWILPLIVIAQFLCTSLWFAGNAVMTDLIELYSLPSDSLGHLTSSVQLGFIAGTLFYAILTIADRFSPSRVFFISALGGSVMNILILPGFNTFFSVLVFRFLTGFFLAGIYPVGMKIASDYFTRGLGKALGFLVGALVLGTAFPHFLKSMSFGFHWSYVIIATSVLAVIGGLLIMVGVGDGPHHKRGQEVDLTAFFRVFNDREFRSPAFGYFGHMWELYAFWAFVPIMLSAYSDTHQLLLNIPLLSFLIIGIGFFSCVVGGYLSLIIGSRKTAFFSMLISGTCCLLSLVMMEFSTVLFLIFLLLWGITVISDSPQFSTLVAYHAPHDIKGTALTIVNCIGFSITIISIEMINFLSVQWGIEKAMVILVIGPIFGLLTLGYNNIKV